MKQSKKPDHCWFCWNEEEVTTKSLSRLNGFDDNNFLYVLGNVPVKVYYNSPYSDFHRFSKQFIEEIE